MGGLLVRGSSVLARNERLGIRVTTISIKFNKQAVVRDSKNIVFIVKCCNDGIGRKLGHE